LLIDAGLEIGKYFPEYKDCVLVCVTETVSEKDMDVLVAELKNFKEIK